MDIESVLNITEIQGFEFQLIAAAKKIYEKRVKSTVVEFTRCLDCKEWWLPDLAKDPYHFESMFFREPTGMLLKHKDHDMVREVRLMRYMCKIAPLNEYGTLDDKYIKAFAHAFNRLAIENMINYCTLSPAMWLPLAHGRVQVGLDTYTDLGDGRRAAVMIFVASDYEEKELNGFMRDHLFVSEGELGDSDWAALFKAAKIEQ